MREFGKLGAVVFPFPSYFTPGARALDYLEWLRGRSGDVPIAIELRHRDWVAGKQRDATMEFLTEHQLAYVCVDVPSGFDSSLPPLSVATTDTAYVRFHGRNTGAWERGADTGDDRFAYDYKDADLEPWVPRLEKLAGCGEVGARDLLRPHHRRRGPQRAPARARAERRARAGTSHEVVGPARSASARRGRADQKWSSSSVILRRCRIPASSASSSVCSRAQVLALGM